MIVKRIAVILNICSSGRALEQSSLRSEVNTFVGKSQELLRALRRGFDEFSRAASLDAERQRFCTRRPTKTDVVTWRLNPGLSDIVIKSGLVKRGTQENFKVNRQIPA